MRFEWDEEKNRLNIGKHGVSFFQAQHAFGDPYRLFAPDYKHSNGEKRFYCFGRVDGGIMTVRFTMRGAAIRIIGAGYWREGRAVYEKENKIHK
ncbi:MAG: BrnT family toxin [Alphaproteobacteria bacterium]|nr:BrnT family toxin [Alphaproteobacteria bacterium]